MAESKEKVGVGTGQAKARWPEVELLPKKGLLTLDVERKILLRTR